MVYQCHRASDYYTKIKICWFGIGDPKDTPSDNDKRTKKAAGISECAVIWKP